MHQSAGLVEMDEREGDAELHRRQRDALLEDRTFRVEGAHGLAARAIIARFLEIGEDRGQRFAILDDLIVGREIGARPVEIGEAHVERIAPDLARHGVHGPLDADHALRAAEAAKRRHRDDVGLQPPRGDARGGQIIAVGRMEHRAVDHARREIRRAAAIGVELNVVDADAALGVEADAPIVAEGVALAGQFEIVVAVEPDLARRAGHVGAERGDGRPGAGLALLAAEAAAHAARLHRHEGVGKPKDARDDVLHLGRVLRRSPDRHLAPLAGRSHRDLSFEIEMLLPADVELAFEPMRREAKRRLHVAAAEIVIRQHARAAGEGVVNSKRRLGLGDVDLRELRRAPRRVARLGDDGEQGLAAIENLVGGEERLVLERRRDVVGAGNVGGRQHGDDAGRGADGFEIEGAQFSRRLVRHADGDMQQSPRARAGRRHRAQGRAHAAARNRGDAACEQPAFRAPAARAGFR